MKWEILNGAHFQPPHQLRGDHPKLQASPSFSGHLGFLSLQTYLFLLWDDSANVLAAAL